MQIKANMQSSNEVGANANEVGANANEVDTNAPIIITNQPSANANEVGTNEVDSVGANANEVDTVDAVGANAVGANANANEVDTVCANANAVDTVGANANEVDTVDTEPPTIPVKADYSYIPQPLASAMQVSAMLTSALKKEKPKEKPTPPKKPKVEEPSTKKKCTHCYSSESNDSRCCGACYYLCPTKSIPDRCEFCPKTFSEYWHSGYIQTYEGSIDTRDPCPECGCDEDCFCTTLCIIPKFATFFPCFLGSLFNNAINACTDCERNYLM
jgi:hypothetical protein